MNRHFVGLDLGQSYDYTAMSILRINPYDPKKLELVYMERVREMLYPQVVQWAQKKLASLSVYGSYELVVDATGVGPAVTDLLTEKRLPFRGVKIHGGDHEKFERGYYRVPKRHLISNLQVLLHSGRLVISGKLGLAQVLRNELVNFKYQINTETAHDSYSAWRENDHDDLLLATSLAAWASKRFGHGVNASLSTLSGPFSTTERPFEGSFNEGLFAGASSW